MAKQNRTPSAARFRTADTVVTTKQADTTILMDLRSGRYFTLNPVSGLIWSVLSAGASVDRVISQVKAEFDAPEERITADVEEFLESLLSAELIRRDE